MSPPTQNLTSNSYPINVYEKIAQKRRELINKTVFWYPLLILLALILLLVLGIVSVAHAELTPKIWPSQQSPFEIKRK